MKLRVRTNSLRLRLTRSEVARFGDVGRVEESVEFGGTSAGQLVYVLESVIDIQAINATYDDKCIVVRVPREQAELWTSSNQVGIEGEQALENGKFLRILIEKDFACLDHRENEDEVDAYPHPNAGRTY